MFNKRDYGKNYRPEDEMIEVNKWDDNEFNGPNQRYQRNGYDRDRDNNQISVYTEIQKNDNDFNYKIDVFGDDNYDKYSSGVPEEGVPQRRPQPTGYGGGGQQHKKQKWFTNFDDEKDQGGSVDIEVKDEDNYNNFNAPKFVVNFDTFKPWNKLKKNRRQESYFEEPLPVDTTDNDLDIYVDDSTDSGSDDKNYGRNYQPKLLTNLSPKLRNEKNDNNYANYDNRNDRDIKYKTPVLKEMIYKTKNKPKSVRYHYEKRVMPPIKVDRRPDHYIGDRYSPMRDQTNRKFIEAPYDMMNTGWSSVQKPMRHISEQPVARVRQYRYGF